MTQSQPDGLPDGESRIPAPLKRLQAALVLFFAIMVLAAAYGGWWYFVATRFEASLETWAQTQRRAGLEIHYSKRTRSGFPGAVVFTFTAPSVSGGGDRPWTWSAESLSLALPPWAFGRLRFDASGSHRGRLSQSDGDHNLQATAGTLRGTVTLGRDRVKRVDGAVEQLVVSADRWREALTLAGGDISLDLTSRAEARFALRSREVILPGSLAAPLGNHIAHFDARGTLTGEITPGPLAAVLERWRDDGGTVDISSFDLDYRPLRMRGNGTLALDPEMQPVAAFSVRAEGLFEAIDGLHGRGLVPLGTALAAKIALGVLSKTPENGGPAYLQLPITVQDQTLYAGSVALLKLRPVNW